jgi:hypothetical protein
VKATLETMNPQYPKPSWQAGEFTIP